MEMSLHLTTSVDVAVTVQPKQLHLNTTICINFPTSITKAASIKRTELLARLDRTFLLQ